MSDASTNQLTKDGPGDARPVFRRRADVTRGDAPAVDLPARGEVHCWRAPLHLDEVARRSARALLDGVERARADRLVDPAKGMGWAAARAGLHTILSSYFATARGRPPHALADDDMGKLYLRDLATDTAYPDNLHFNLSHSGDWMLVALTRGQSVGVDIEEMTDKSDAQLVGLARYAFSTEEYTRWEAARAASLEEAARMFWRMWTRKEAYIKWLGVGLRLELESFDVSGSPEARLIAARHEDAPAPEEIAMRGFTVDDRHMGALVLRAPLRTITWYEMAPSMIIDGAGLLTNGE